MTMSKGDWKFERSSGFAGWRCQECQLWVFDIPDKKCQCDKISNERDLKITKFFADKSKSLKDKFLKESGNECYEFSKAYPEGDLIDKFSKEYIEWLENRVMNDFDREDMIDFATDQLCRAVEPTEETLDKFIKYQ